MKSSFKATRSRRVTSWRMTLIAFTVAGLGQMAHAADARVQLERLSHEQSVAAVQLKGLKALQVDAAGIPTRLDAELGVLRADSALQQSDMAALKARLAPLLKMHGNEDWQQQRSDADEQGQAHYRYRQTINGLEVIGGELIVHTGKDGRIAGITTHFLPGTGLTKKGRLNARQALGVFQQADDEDSKARLVSPARQVYFRAANGQGHLAWEMTVKGALRETDDCQIPIQQIVIDADTGTLLQRNPLVRPGLYREVYSLTYNPGMPPCEPAYWDSWLAAQEGDSPTLPVIASAYHKSKNAYDSLLALGRDSWNGAGAKMISRVLSGANYSNAYWYNGEITLGDGDGVTWGNFANSTDIIGHEFGHGVVETTAGLVYTNESGALNESLADILGVSAEVNANGGVVNSNTWLLGETVYTPNTAGDALRYMHNPTADAGRYSDPQFYSRDYYPERYTGIGDNGGVHFNSGISNLAFYLLAQGGSHPRGRTTVAVPALGLQKAERYFYNTLRTRLLSNSGFTGSTGIAEQMVAYAQSITAPTSEVSAICAAWAAVGVSAGASCPAVPPGGGGIPTAPSTLRAQSEMCYGWNTVTWATSTDATSYQLFGSSSQTNFTNAWQVYSGPNTEASINFSATTYLKVKACNASGCSPLSTATATARRVTACY